MGLGKAFLIMGLLYVLQLKGCDCQGCPLGYKGVRRNKLKMCVDVDECTVSPCGHQHICINTEGSYHCSCEKGYTAAIDAYTTCIDANECVEDPDICGPNAKCTNTVGDYYCTCEDGFINSREPKNFHQGDNVTCIDVDECTVSPCGHQHICINTEGTYHCSCEKGYTAAIDAYTTCIDANECVEYPDICGPNAKCTNTVGDYYCTGEDGFINSREPNNFHQGDNVRCIELWCDQFKADSTQSSSSVSNILSLMRNSCIDLSEGKQSHGDVLLELFTAVDAILESPGQLNNSDVTELLQTVEDAVRLIGPQLQDNYTYIETNLTEVKLAAWKGKTPPTGPIHLSSHSAALDTDWQTATGNGTDPGFAALVSYKNLEKSLNHSQNLSGHQKDGVDPTYYQVYSKVVSVVVSNPSTELLDTPISLTLRHLQGTTRPTSEVSFICAYWTTRTGQEWKEGAWATDGCTQQSTNSTHTACVCEHLSSFAVLMALYPMEVSHEWLTMLGLVASLLCLAVCIFTFRFCRSIKGTHTTIHLHLCICLFIADLIFLAGVSRTEPEVGCRLVAALLHYFFLGTFCWMLLEGVQLYRVVKPILNAAKHHPRYLYPVGYGTPLVIVVISAISRPMGYGTKRHCWLSLEHGLIWSFTGPVFGIIALNVFFFIVIIWKLIQKLSACAGSDTLRKHSPNQDHANLHKIKMLTIAAIAVMCVLGLPWVFGAFLFKDGTVAVGYIFTILNSPQGVLIFIFHCLRSKKIRQWYIKKLFICRPTTGQESQESRSPPTTRESIPLTQRDGGLQITVDAQDQGRNFTEAMEAMASVAPLFGLVPLKK